MAKGDDATSSPFCANSNALRSAPDLMHQRHPAIQNAGQDRVARRRAGACLRPLGSGRWTIGIAKPAFIEFVLRCWLGVGSRPPARPGIGHVPQRRADWAVVREAWSRDLEKIYRTLRWKDLGKEPGRWLDLRVHAAAAKVVCGSAGIRELVGTNRPRIGGKAMFVNVCFPRARQAAVGS